MKKLSVFACLSFFALASFTTKPANQSTPNKMEVAPAEGITGQISIISIDPDGYSGVAMTSSGVAVRFINPLHLPVSLGTVAVASISMDCPIIDPPTKDGKPIVLKPNPKPLTTSDDGSATETTTYGVAIILSI